LVNYVRKIRQVRKLGEEELAKQVGVTRACINMISNSRRLPSLPLALRISETLGVNVGDLWELEKSDRST